LARWSASQPTLNDEAVNRAENILVLPNGKGNSSQQMGEHGREALRKCVYVWRKTKTTMQTLISLN
jgi:hypothetical protein